MYGARLKRAAHGSLKIQDAKNSPSARHRTNLLGYIFITKARIDNQKKTCSTAISLPRADNMVNFAH